MATHKSPGQTAGATLARPTAPSAMARSGKRLERAVNVLRSKRLNLGISSATSSATGPGKENQLPASTIPEPPTAEMEKAAREMELEEYMREPCHADGTEIPLEDILKWWKVREPV
jgi:hypothetical protein